MQEKISRDSSVLVHSGWSAAKLYHLVRAMRPHQWAKNLLLFAPLLLGHRYSEAGVWAKAAVAFWTFCAASSSVYLFNDILDVKSDRVHPTKKNRPIASGALPVWLAIVGLIALLSGSIWAATFTSEGFRVLLAIYLFANLLYTSSLKKVLFLDVLVLSAFYTFRLHAGGAATDVAISHWLSGFTMFLFLSLAILKRYIEVSNLEEGSQTKGRGYIESDRVSLFCLGVSSGYMSIVIFALYTFSDTTRSLYQSPQYLWLANFLLLYWVSVLYVKAGRKQLDDDPILYVIRDKLSLTLGLAIGCVFLLARFAT